MRRVLPPPPWETWRDNFIQDAPESLARWSWERLSPEPSQVNLDNIDLKSFHSLTVPKSYIYCRQDKAMPPGYFLPGCRRVCGHAKSLLMFTRPVELADKIIEGGSG